MSAEIHIRFSEPGWHCWKQAPSHRAYLAQSHRHLFSVQVDLPVLHDDREVEFHDVRDLALAAFRGFAASGGDFGGQSCEMLARRLASELGTKLSRWCRVQVWEDREFGATVTKDAPAEII